MPLPTGKVSPYELAKLVFPYLELDDERVIVGAELGMDAAVIEFEDRVLVASSDPITGAFKDPAWLSVHVNANDVATMGGVPEWYLANFFLPEGSDRADVEELIKRAIAACGELDVALIGGHTEVTPKFGRVIISAAMIGEAPKEQWVSAAGGKPSDRILLSKGAAIEGTFILASDRENELKSTFGEEFIARAKDFKQKLSVVDEALTAVKAGGVNAMHDPTEGGLVGGIHELADASKVGFEIEADAIPVAEETREICKHFGIDPLCTINSGSLLVCAQAERSEDVLKALRDLRVEAADIGKLVKDRNTRKMDGKTLKFPDQDELWRIFKDS